MPITPRTLLTLLQGTCLVAGYGFACVLLLQPNNRYSWMAAEGVTNLPLDEESLTRVWWLASFTAVAVLVGLAASVQSSDWPKRRSRVLLLHAVPLAYALWRFASAYWASSY